MQAYKAFQVAEKREIIKDAKAVKKLLTYL